MRGADNTHIHSQVKADKYDLDQSIFSLHAFDPDFALLTSQVSPFQPNC